MTERGPQTEVTQTKQSLAEKAKYYLEQRQLKKEQKIRDRRSKALSRVAEDLATKTGAIAALGLENGDLQVYCDILGRELALLITHPKTYLPTSTSPRVDFLVQHELRITAKQTWQPAPNLPIEEQSHQRDIQRAARETIQFIAKDVTDQEIPTIFLEKIVQDLGHKTSTYTSDFYVGRKTLKTVADADELTQQRFLEYNRLINSSTN